MPAFSQSLERSLQQALALAKDGNHEYAAPEHLLLALIDDPDAAAVMRACHVDRDRLRRDLVAYIEIELEKFAADGSEDSKLSAGFQRTMQSKVVTHGREQVTGADVLVAILTERESQAAAFLQEQGMTRYDATLYICHGIAKGDRLSRGQDDPVPPAVAGKPPGLLAKVLLINDDYTPMEFVVQVLERVFDKDYETATRIMLQIHHEGIGICGVYPCDAAEAKVAEVLDLAREQQHPLQCVLERNSSS